MLKQRIAELNLCCHRGHEGISEHAVAKQRGPLPAGLREFVREHGPDAVADRRPFVTEQHARVAHVLDVAPILAAYRVLGLNNDSLGLRAY